MRKTRRYIVSIVALCILAVTAWDIGQEEQADSFAFSEETRYQVLRVVDGDTLQIDWNGEAHKVRLIGIDAPESVHSDKSKNTDFGTIASDYTKSLLEETFIYLELDVQETDRYGRILAYVYMEDKTFLNEKLVREGYAKVATYPPNIKYEDIFIEAQKKAREEKLGVWAEDIAF